MRIPLWQMESSFNQCSEVLVNQMGSLWDLQSGHLFLKLYQHLALPQSLTCVPWFRITVWTAHPVLLTTSPVRLMEILSVCSLPSSIVLPSPGLPLTQFHSEPLVKVIWRETSLVVQWLRICLAGLCRVRSSPGQGTKIPHAVGLLRHQGACMRRPRSHVLQLRPAQTNKWKLKIHLKKIT